MPELMTTFSADTSELLQGLQGIDDDLKQIVSSLGRLTESSAATGAALSKMAEDTGKALANIGGQTGKVTKSVKDTTSALDKAFAPVEKGFESMISGLLKGTQTWQKAVTQGIHTMLTAELQADAKFLQSKLLGDETAAKSTAKTTQQGLLAWIFSEDKKTAASKAGAATRDAAEASQSGGFLLRLVHMLAQWLGLESAKTGATETGNAARTASDAAAALEALVPLKIYAIGAIIAEAAIAGAAAFADSASLGPAGLAAAPAAGMAAFGEASSYLAFVSAKGGAWDLPSDTLLMAHARESVLPAHIAEPMRDFFTGNAKGGAPDMHVHVHAMDARSVRQLLIDNHSAVGEALHRAWRNGNPRMR